MTVDMKLVGLDFGTTTSSAIVASAQLTRNSVTGRSELAMAWLTRISRWTSSAGRAAAR
jgi:molecular chaperone DnaK (HSP70)